MPTDPTNSLQSRLAALKSTNSVQQESIEECKIETPLWVFLYIYLRARRECYIDYMEGAKALAEFLNPIKIPSNFESKFINLPPLYRGSYEVVELVKILSKDQFNLSEREYVEYAIYYTLTQQMTGNI